MQIEFTRHISISKLMRYTKRMKVLLFTPSDRDCRQDDNHHKIVLCNIVVVLAFSNLI